MAARLTGLVLKIIIIIIIIFSDPLGKKKGLWGEEGRATEGERG